jgi:hypothetical protein
MPTQLAQAASAMEQALWVMIGSVGYSLGYSARSKRKQERSLKYKRPAYLGWS